MGQVIESLAVEGLPLDLSRLERRFESCFLGLVFGLEISQFALEVG